MDWKRGPGRSQLVGEAEFLTTQVRRLANKLAPTTFTRLLRDSGVSGTQGALSANISSINGLETRTR